MTVNVVGFIKKVLVGSNNPNWKIFWDGLIFNCPGVTQNFWFFNTKFCCSFYLLFWHWIWLDCLKNVGMPLSSLRYINVDLQISRVSPIFNCPGVTQNLVNLLNNVFWIILLNHLTFCIIKLLKKPLSSLRYVNVDLLENSYF